MKTPSKAQIWARKRNMAKFHLLGAIANLKRESNSQILTQRQHACYIRAINELRAALINWDGENEASKEYYLGTP